MELLGAIVQLNVSTVIPVLSGLGILVFLFNKYYLTFIGSRFLFYSAYTRFTYVLYLMGCLVLGGVALAWLGGIRRPM